MINNENLKTLLNSVIFDLEGVLNTTKEKYTIETLNNVIQALNSIKNDTENKEYNNFIKRILYKRMTDLKESKPDKSLEIYKTYQKLKANQISPNEALERVINNI